MTDLQATGLFAALLLAVVAVGEGLRAGLGWPAEATRRVVHVGVGLVTAASPSWFAEPTGLYVLAGTFLVANAVASARGWLPGMHGVARRSWGTATFPLALLIALWLCWALDPGRVYVLQVAFVVLALADPAAAWVGTRAPRPGRFEVAGAGKSVAGSAAFAVIAIIATTAALRLVGPAETWGDVLAAALAVAALATAAEAMGRNGWDNVWIVLAVVVPLAHLDRQPEAAGLHVAALACAAAFGGLAHRVRALDLSGALAGSLLAWGLVALGGVAWAVPALTFFVLSSALSVIGRRRKAGAEARSQKGSRRDVGQVLANGGVGMALLAASVFAPSEALYWAFVGSFAAAAADTWGTEVGTLVGGTTRWLGVGRVVPPGTSGGMSAAGTLGAVAGAASVVGPAVALAGGAGAAVAVGLVGVGVGAAVVDSVLGATLQARYRGPDGSLTERPSRGGRPLALATGVRWLDNDGVNWACTGVGAVLAALLCLVG